ncbi:hatching enzyme 1.2-like isoform X2 [Clytia hemisphaerica]|uniref:Metalloendopeptidase n=1 Tax=Clytia hemisphaerica TaxID=252671 RepID=A0A7M5XA56_9CNID
MKIVCLCVLAFAFANGRPDGNSHADILTINQKMFEKAEKAVSGFSSNSNIKERDMLEGDIVLTPKLRTYLDNQRSGAQISPFDAAVRSKWPNARIPFTYNRLSSDYRKAVNEAIAEYNQKTCIRFVPKTSRDKSWIEFMHGGGCYSMIGRVGGKQQISLGNGCGSKGVAIHEMMHALGFFHEQSRRDRDEYVSIQWQYIPGNIRYNFEKYRHGQADTLGAPYDKKSIMHYSNKAFSINGKPTIVSRSDRNEILGQRDGLSVIDIKQLRKLYQCKGEEKVVITEECKDKHELCPTLAKERLCTVTVSDWVKDNCQKSCDTCPTPAPQKPSCVPNERAKHCGQWKRQGYCDPTSKYSSWMGKNCKACGKCI